MSHFDKYDAELKALRQLVARKHEHYPEWSLEQCAHAAVEESFDPQAEANPSLRAFLLARLSDVRSEDRG